jgi:hypothetical protein
MSKATPKSTNQPSARQALATEKPVPTSEALPQASSTQEWVVTVNNSDGTILKIEKLDAETGEREELSKDEYSTLYGYLNSFALYWQGANEFTTALFSADAPALKSYYQGIADYYMDQQREAAPSPQMQSYYQGIADYYRALASS